MRVLTWNLFHGRAVPERRHDLLPAFTQAIAAWPWDVALLQEVPPWWPLPLARASGASMRMARTARNLGLPVRRPLARWRPDLIRSSGGGANAILVRGAAIREHRAAVLRHWPERRVVHGVLLDAPPGLPPGDLWIANVHAQVRPHVLARADLVHAGVAVRGWSAGAPVLLGGDMNVPDPVVAGFADLGGHQVDRFLGDGVRAAGPVRRLERGTLSDHAPLLLEVSAG